MSNLTTLPKGDSAWLLRKSIQRIIQQVSVLETNIGSSTTGNSSNTQIIFNDAGTLRGDSGLTYNKTTDLLSVGAATITGDLTVDTSTLVVNSSQNRIGIGFSGNASSGRLQISQPLGSTIDGALRITDDATTSFVFNNVSNGVSGIWSSGAIAFGVGSGTFSEAMRLNSTGLGVGVAPDRKLHVGSNVYPQIRLVYTGVNTYDIGVTSGGVLALNHTSTTNGLVLDQNANVGIGVTPSAWGATAKAIQIGSYSGIYNDVDFTVVVNNAFFNGTNNIYRNTAPASQYYQQAGSHVWRTAPSGTAGNTITFTQAMTLDASGNLLLGTTSSPLASRVSVGVTNGQPDAFVIRNSAATAGLYWRLAYINSANTFHILNQGGVGVYLTDGATSWTGTSDERLKDIIEPINNAVAKVGSLRSVIGKFKTDSEGTRRSFLIAQDVQAVLPEAVDTTNADAFGVRYSEVIPLLVAAIKELTAEVNALKNA